MTRTNTRTTTRLARRRMRWPWERTGHPDRGESVIGRDSRSHFRSSGSPRNRPLPKDFWSSEERKPRRAFTPLHAHVECMSDPSALPEDILPPRKGTRNHLVLVGAGVTGAVLCAGFVAFKSGHANFSQHMMRARIFAQGATVALMVGTSGAIAMPNVIGGSDGK